MLVNEFQLNQRETAEKLETTEAAISRYLSGKRGTLVIADEEIIQEIRSSAERISKEKDADLVNEICTICKLIRKKDVVTGIQDSY